MMIYINIFEFLFEFDIYLTFMTRTLSYEIKNRLLHYKFKCSTLICHLARNCEMELFFRQIDSSLVKYIINNPCSNL